jgi:ABC-type glycerol-3-phosphate transport system substrate-binding protein
MRKRLGVVALVLAFAVFATAAAQARPHAGVTINFMTYVWQPTTVAATKQIVQQWNATHPNIQVNEISLRRALELPDGRFVDVALLRAAEQTLALAAAHGTR